MKLKAGSEIDRIISFIKTTLKEQGFQNVIIAMSGGIDSAVSFCLLRKAVSPLNIFVTHLYYFDSHMEKLALLIRNAAVPQENIYNLSIKSPVDALEKTLPNKILKQVQNDNDRIRLGNIMARVRMIMLYDLAKKHNALVCGTENKSEKYLGYFTRFGDEASDIEPIQHLYKTQVYELAKFLKIPKVFIDQAPTAGLWEGQTDEGEFGFSYKEADQVLYFYFDKKMGIKEIKGKGFKNAEKIIRFAEKNSFKHHLPHTIP